MGHLLKMKKKFNQEFNYLKENLIMTHNIFNLLLFRGINLFSSLFVSYEKRTAGIDYSFLMHNQ